MDDTIENKFKDATAYLVNGHKQKAQEKFLEIYKSPENQRQKLNAIYGLLDALSPVEDTEQLISLSNEAIKIAQAISDKGAEALVKARKAVFLQNKTTPILYERDCLKLSPDWIAFALESDKQRYEYLDNKANVYKRDTEQLFDEALQISSQSKDLILKGRVLMLQADLVGVDYLYKLTEIVQPKGEFKTKLFKNYRLKLLGLDRYLVFNRKERNELKKIINRCEELFLESAKYFQEAGDENMIGYAYYNLVIPLNSSFQFRKAWRYLKKAKQIAEKYKDVSLTRSIEDMENTLNEKNSKHYKRLKKGLP